MLTKTMVDTRTTDPAIATKTREYLTAMQAEFAVAFSAAIAGGEIKNDADAQRLARRFQSNVTALRLAMHQGIDDHAFQQLTEDMATEIDALRI